MSPVLDPLLRALANFGFARPWWLLLLLALPPLAFLRGRAGGAPAVRYSSTAPLRGIGRRRPARAGAFRGWLVFAAMAVGILALARPQVANSFTQIEASGIDIMLTLDVSRSMLAEDYQGANGQRANRIDTVKEITAQFIRERPNDRIGMTAFAGRPYLVSPLTLDHGWLLQNLERLRCGLVEDGTAIGSALASSTNRLKDSKSPSRLVVLLSDGGNNAGRVSPETAAEAAAALGIKVYTIGVGSQGDAMIPIPDGFGHTVMRMIPADLDEKTLGEVARVAGGRYFAAKTTRGLKEIYAEIDRYEKSRVKVSQYRQHRDLFPWLLGGGCALLGLHLLLSQTAWRRLP